MSDARRDERPWGRYEVLTSAPGSQVKRIEVFAGKRFSLQKHARRAEKWIFIAGRGIVTLGKKEISVAPGSFVEVPVGEVHRIHNPGAEPLVLIEVQFGDYLGEDDIVRLEDDFGRI